MRVELTNEQDALAIDEPELEREIAALAERAGYRGGLSVALVTDAVIRDLNREFLDHDYPTDVLAFPLDEEEGEVVVSVERAVEEAGRRGVDPRAEMLLYVVHGILHLLGYDDAAVEDARRMHATTLRLLRSRGHRNRIDLPERRG